MRGSHLPFGAIASLSGAAGLLALSRDSATTTPSPNAPTSNPQTAHLTTRGSDSSPSPRIQSRHLLSWPGLSASPLSPLLSCKADASGYDAMQPAPAATPPAAPLQGPYESPLEDGSLQDSDTITGVFHRLDPQRAKLVLVQVVFRHGARTPLSNRREMWGGQPWDVCGEAYQAAFVRLFSTAGVENPVSKHDQRQRSVVLPGGCRKGELTLLGQSQARELGSWLRATYVAHLGFLPAEHQSGLVEARTTNVSRTIATLRGVLTGLYPDLPARSFAVLPAAPPQQPQPTVTEAQEGASQAAAAQAAQDPAAEEEAVQTPRVTTSGDLDEILYADTRACPHLGSFMTLAKESGRAAIRADPEYPWARGELLRLLGMEPAAFDSQPWIFTDVHDNLTSLAAHGKRLPPGFADQPRLLAAINRLATREFASEVAPSVRDTHGRTVLRLSMGRLLHTLVENMRGAAAGAAGGPAGGSAPGGPRPHMYLYSGHDSTIMPLLSALGHDVNEWPPYLSNLVLELWQVQPTTPTPTPTPTPAAAAAASQSEAPRYVVRVLYNLQELPLPHCPPGFLPSLATFEREVVGPFLLSSQHHAELCRVKVAHDQAMPQPKQHPPHQHHQAGDKKAQQQQQQQPSTPTPTPAPAPATAAAVAGAPMAPAAAGGPAAGAA